MSRLLISFLATVMHSRLHGTGSYSQQGQALDHTHNKAGNGEKPSHPDEHVTQSRLHGTVVTEQLALLSNNQSERETHAIHGALQPS